MHFVTVLFFILISVFTSAQKPAVITGLWQGLLIPHDNQLDASAPYFLEIKADGDRYIGLSREEIYNTDFYAIGKLYGEGVPNGVKFKQVVFQKKSGTNRTNWCKIETELVFNKNTGYLEGDYKSPDCRQKVGRIVLHRSKATFSEEDRKILTHVARDQMVKDLKKGRPAPEIRDIQRQNFEFQPIYFDYDKDSIRPEYKPFLKEIIEIIDGHSDLRVKVVGNTDADGSAEYNIGLSKRRAQSIINFFVKNGISEDRLIIEFKGEHAPVDDNSTPEGKQKNRRVEFSFI